MRLAIELLAPGHGGFTVGLGATTFGQVAIWKESVGPHSHQETRQDRTGQRHTSGLFGLGAGVGAGAGVGIGAGVATEESEEIGAKRLGIFWRS